MQIELDGLDRHFQRAQSYSVSTPKKAISRSQVKTPSTDNNDKLVSVLFFLVKEIQNICYDNRDCVEYQIFKFAANILGIFMMLSFNFFLDSSIFLLFNRANSMFMNLVKMNLKLKSRSSTIPRFLPSILFILLKKLMMICNVGKRMR